MPFHHATDGTRIHYQDTGTGTPIVLIPGLGGDGTFWSGVAGLVPATYRLITVDHRGAGQSDRPIGPYSIPQIAQDTLGILSDLSISKASLLGHSTGGMIAQTIATTHPERVDNLVLSGTWDQRDLRFRHMFEARMALLQNAEAEAYQKLTQALGYDPDWMEQHATAMKAELETAEARLAPMGVQLARIAMLLDHDCHTALPALQMPTLVLGAQDDALIPFRYSERLADRIPSARLHALSGGHFYPRTYPEPFAQAVTQFLGELT